MTTATVLLKTGEEIQIPIGELEDYLYSNAALIETRHVQRRGKRREQEVVAEKTSANNK